MVINGCFGCQSATSSDAPDLVVVAVVAAAATTVKTAAVAKEVLCGKGFNVRYTGEGDIITLQNGDDGGLPTIVKSSA